MITIKQLTKKFAPRALFDNLSLHFEPGKVYALIGPSGSGKTTLLNIMAKLESCDQGQVYYRHQLLQQIKANVYFRDHLGYLFQNFGLLESESVQTNLDLGLIGKRLTRKARAEQQQAALAQVNLSYVTLNQKIFTLSGGEAQRVALAKLILKEPPLILADEPTAALDPQTGYEVMSLLLSLKEAGRTIIIATHNPMIWERADEVIDLGAYQ